MSGHCHLVSLSASGGPNFCMCLLHTVRGVFVSHNYLFPLNYFCRSLSTKKLNREHRIGQKRRRDVKFQALGADGMIEKVSGRTRPGG